MVSVTIPINTRIKVLNKILECFLLVLYKLELRVCAKKEDFSCETMAIIRRPIVEP